MKQTLKLSIIYFKETLYSLMGQGKKNSKRNTPLVMFAMFAFVALALGYSLYTIAETMVAFNMPGNILIIGLLLGIMMSIMITLNDTQGTMYKSKDYDMLMSLPIKNISIISAKYISTFFVTLLYFFVVALPTFVVYFIFNPITFGGIIFAIIATITIPAFSQLISSLLAWLVNIITSKMQNKNIMRVIFSLVMAVGLAVFISVANSEIFGSLFADGFPLWFKIVFANIYFMFLAITQTSFVNFLISVAISLGLTIISILILSLGFKKINSSLQISNVKRSNKPLLFNQKPAFNTLLKKEATTFFNSPVYCVNGLVGIIMSVVVTVITIVMHKDLSEYLEAAYMFAAIEMFCMALCTGVAPTTSVSVSMEGSKFQNLKALPLEFKHIALSKMALNLIIGLPVTIICTIIFICIVPVGAIIAITMLIFIVSAIVTQTIIGLLINLKFPKLNWSSETQAAKGGVSLILTMLINMLLAALPLVITIVCVFNIENVSYQLILGLCTLFEVLVMIACIITLKFKGKQLFNAISV